MHLAGSLERQKHCARDRGAAWVSLSYKTLAHLLLSRPVVVLPSSRGGIFRHRHFRTAATLVVAALCLAMIATVFWYQDVRNSLPTPVPRDFHPPAFGANVTLPATLAPQPEDTRPLLLHFYNNDCPCSRFNVDQARNLVQKFGGQVRSVLILQTDSAPADAQEALATAAKRFGGIEAVIDHAGRIARHYGVYSTPQAVLLDHNRIAYRGNYNVSRYCTDASTEFARLAVEAVLAHQPLPHLPELAYRAYGCELPTNLAN